MKSEEFLNDSIRNTLMISERRDNMKIRKITRGAVLICSMLVMLMGCGAKDFSKNDALNYYKNCYGESFKLVSFEEATLPSEAPYTDSNGEKHTNSPQKDYQTFTAVDKNGITCTLRNQFRYGCSGSVNNLTDDYAVQWLKAHPEIYEPLFDSDYECEFGDRHIFMYIKDFEDVKPAVKLAYSVVSDKKSALPKSCEVNMGTADHKITVNRICPEIIIKSPNGREIVSLSFSEKPQNMNRDTDILAYVAEGCYINCVKGSEYENDLPQNALSRSEGIKMEIYSGSEKLDAFFQGNYYGELKISDSAANGEQVCFQNITEICKAAGYEIEYGSFTVKFKKGKRIITLHLDSENNNRINVSINGKNRYFSSSGGFIALYAEDYSELFGIEFDYDFEKGIATIIE